MIKIKEIQKNWIKIAEVLYFRPINQFELIDVQFIFINKKTEGYEIRLIGDPFFRFTNRFFSCKNLFNYFSFTHH